MSGQRKKNEDYTPRPAQLDENTRINIPATLGWTMCVGLIAATLFLGGIYAKINSIEKDQKSVWTLAEQREFVRLSSPAKLAEPDEIHNRIRQQ